MDLSFLTKLVDTSKLGGWVRAGVAAGFGVLIAKWPGLGQWIDPGTQAELGAAAATLVVGVWSHFAKSVADGTAGQGAQAVKKIAPALMLCVLAGGMLGGCAQLQSFEQKVKTAYDALDSSQLNYNYVNAGLQSFEGLQKIAAIYLRLPTCNGSNGPACHDRHATAPIRAAIAVGRKARTDVIAYMDANPCAVDANGNVVSCPLMPNGVYAGLKAAVGELNDLYTTYKVNLTGVQ